MTMYDPFREMERLRRDTERYFGTGGPAQAAPGRAFRLAFLPGRAARLYPLVNVYQEGDMFRVEALAPGLDPSAIEVTVVRDTLTIAGEKPGLQGVAPERVHRGERAAGPFVRTVQLPDEASPEEVTAEYRDGLLVITVPRAEHTRPRRVQVKAV